MGSELRSELGGELGSELGSELGRELGSELRSVLAALQWPTSDVCKDCRSPSDRWREGQVLLFLRGSYCLRGSECWLARNLSEKENKSRVGARVGWMEWQDRAIG